MMRCDTSWQVDDDATMPRDIPLFERRRGQGGEQQHGRTFAKVFVPSQDWTSRRGRQLGLEPKSHHPAVGQRNFSLRQHRLQSAI